MWILKVNASHTGPPESEDIKKNLLIRESRGPTKNPNHPV